MVAIGGPIQAVGGSVDLLRGSSCPTELVGMNGIAMSGSGFKLIFSVKKLLSSAALNISTEVGMAIFCPKLFVTMSFPSDIWMLPFIKSSYVGGGLL